jgi:sortase (surface protein transpeptidase)
MLSSLRRTRHHWQETDSMTTDHNPAAPSPIRSLQSQPRYTRRGALGILAVGAAATLTGWRQVSAQGDATQEAEATPPLIQSNQVGEMPTTGGARSGPVGSQPSQFASTSRTKPVGIVVEKAQIQAEIEELDIVDGTMQNPTGPWVVSWYRQTAELGETGNVVLAGHVDYWNVGPAVFYHVRDLAAGDEIVMTGENGNSYTYAVESNDTYDVKTLTTGKITELVGPTPDQVVTLITCGGEFDYENGEYLSRTVVRAKIKPNDATPPA